MLTVENASKEPDLIDTWLNGEAPERVSFHNKKNVELLLLIRTSKVRQKCWEYKSMLTSNLI
jgi:hypothetical protein